MEEPARVLRVLWCMENIKYSDCVQDNIARIWHPRVCIISTFKQSRTEAPYICILYKWKRANIADSKFLHNAQLIWEVRRNTLLYFMCLSFSRFLIIYSTSGHLSFLSFDVHNERIILQNDLLAIQTLVKSEFGNEDSNQSNLYSTKSNIQRSKENQKIFF